MQGSQRSPSVPAVPADGNGRAGKSESALPHWPSAAAAIRRRAVGRLAGRNRRAFVGHQLRLQPDGGQLWPGWQTGIGAPSLAISCGCNPGGGQLWPGWQNGIGAPSLAISSGCTGGGQLCRAGRSESVRLRWPSAAAARDGGQLWPGWQIGIGAPSLAISCGCSREAGSCGRAGRSESALLHWPSAAAAAEGGQLWPGWQNGIGAPSLAISCGCSRTAGSCGPAGRSESVRLHWPSAAAAREAGSVAGLADRNRRAFIGLQSAVGVELLLETCATGARGSGGAG